jgi:hypothetical protein
MSNTVKDESNMNRCIIAIGLFITLTIHALGQGGTGTFEFSNSGTTPDRHIYIGEYMGTVKPQEGDNYRIAIFWGPEGTLDENALVQVGAPTGFLPGPAGSGQFSAGERTITDPGAAMDGPVLTFQARGWDRLTGETWEAAAANPIGAIGKGPMFEMKTKDPFNLFEPLPRIGDAAGWRGFAIAVPEPSAWGLALLCATTLLFFRRR